MGEITDDVLCAEVGKNACTDLQAIAQSTKNQDFLSLYSSSGLFPFRTSLLT
ncbi:MAG: hypothetical protein IJU76_06885 [Desulfovibrionaceae bacterium]|nr:hypothetical protein [Desulfovibrionaceae bacterium]